MVLKKTPKKIMPAVSKENSKPLKILMVATEASPYISVGGAGSVMGNLSKALVQRGHDVRIFIPKFGTLDESKHKIHKLIDGLEVPTGDEHTPTLSCNVKYLKNDAGVTIYFLENQEYYEKRANVYGYSDDTTRFLLLSRGVLEFIKTGEFVPDVIHCNDWHTGAVSNYMKTMYNDDNIISKISTIFTIHNLAYQGTFDHQHVSELNYDDGKSHIPSIFSPRVNSMNFMRRGILYSDAVNTVSKTYSKEILTPELGEGLDKLLLELRDKLYGIVNGIDYKEMDPNTDTLIEKNYDINTIDRRVANKRALQKEFDIPVDPDAFVLGFVGRLDHMKGIDMLIEVLDHLLKDFNVQFVQVGGGDWSISDDLKALKGRYPTKVGIHPYPNFTLPRLIFAGTDAIVYPSRFEPCGIVQLEAMRYGAIPIVRKVGGLVDTVIQFNTKTGVGNGFMFDDFDPYSLFGQIVTAYQVRSCTGLWDKLQKNAMQADFSWDYSAREYVKLYEKARVLRKKWGTRRGYVGDLLG